MKSELNQNNLSPILVVSAFLGIKMSADSGYVANQNMINVEGQLETQLQAQAKINLVFSADMLLIATDYQMACKLAVLKSTATFSIQDMKDVECNYELDTLTMGLKTVTIVNPCRFDNSCPANTKIYLSFMSANLLFQQSYSGTITFTAFSANNLEVCKTSLPTSSLKTLETYPLDVNQMVATRSVTTASAATAITLHYTIPTRLIAGAVITMHLPKDQITISSKPTTCKALLPLSFDCAFTLDSSDSNYYKVVVT